MHRERVSADGLLKRIMNRRFRFLFLMLGILAIPVLDALLHPLVEGNDLGTLAINPAEFSGLYQPNTYASLRPGLVWEDPSSAGDASKRVETNRYGMRMGDVSLDKSPGIVRVAVLGDSLPFGWGVPPGQAFPAVLETVLNTGGPLKYEVLNFGAPGFTAYHALRQYENLVHNFQPDILILALGLYDSLESRLSEKELVTRLRDDHLLEEPGGFPRFWRDHSAVGTWLHQRRLRAGREAIAEEIQARAARGAWVDKVAAGDFVQAVESILGHHLARGGRAVLVNTDLLNSKLTRTFEDLAQRRDLPLLDLRTLFDRLGQFEERRKSFALSLANNADYETDGFNHFYAEANSTYLFRVFVPESLSVDSAVFITGNHPLLGDGRPNQIRMYDDGSHGDERALDRIWSLRLHFDQPPTLFFTFTTGGVEGDWGTEPGAYDNTVKNHAFLYQVTPPDFTDSIEWKSPVYILHRIPFAHLLLNESSPFPNALGHKAIARRLAHLILERHTPPAIGLGTGGTK